ncbi:MAG: amidohydrolase family protein [Rhodothermales bacterium]|nr:amidohydrolase family protein [Rhodothermales bacterium]
MTPTRHAFAFLLFLVLPAGAQDMSFEEYEPRSTLVVPEHPVTRAKFPFIDIHAHQNRASEMNAGQAGELIEAMDALNMAVMVNLSGGSGDRLKHAIANLEGRHPGRFAHFANINFDAIDDPDFGVKAAAQLEADVRAGARGLKIFKNLGMFVKYANGERVKTDDPRLDPIWAKCGELGIPVLIHVGEPAPFYEPQDQFNERWLELKEFPNRKRPPEEFPTWEVQMAEQHNVFRKHPGTTFINAHLGWMGNDLDRLGRLMDELPNMVTELGAVIAELGRQPRHAREFLIKYQDRVLMGKDSWAPEEYHVYFRVFETADEYFPYYRKRHAFWSMYGLDLPDETLRHIYYKNALRIVPGLDASLFPAE